jgi:hypothetical protein
MGVPESARIRWAAEGLACFTIEKLCGRGAGKGRGIEAGETSGADADTAIQGLGVRSRGSDAPTNQKMQA